MVSVRFLTFALTLVYAAHNASSKSLRAQSYGEAANAKSMRVLPEGTIVCRVTIESTMMKDGSENEVTICIPIRDGKESDKLKVMDLPSSVTFKNQAAINEGRLVLQISDADESNSRVAVSERSVFKKLTDEESRHHYDDPDEHKRGILGHRLLATTGTQTIAIVRISAPGGPNRYTKAALQKAWFGADGSVKAQTLNCSFGALKWVKGPYYDIKLAKNISTFKDRDAVQTAVEARLKKIVNKDLQYVANKIVFCYPRYVPGDGWVASATIEGWRARFNDEFCDSLSVGMHEIGHTIGLLHSSKINKNQTEEYGDRTGYMGISYYGSGHPDECYNGQKNWELGWYQDHQANVTGEAVVRLVAFVDYKKAGVNESVVVQVDNEYYLQYNKAKSFNYETMMYADKVTVTSLLQNGNSLVLAGLGVNETYSDGDTVIEVCSSETGSEGQDVMIVAINGACPGTET